MMKTINVILKSVTPLLMNSPKHMIEEAEDMTKSKSNVKKRDIKKEADKLAYKMKNGELYIPSEAVKGCLIRASNYKKVSKYALKPIIAGGCRIEPNQISLGTKKYDYDVCVFDPF